MNIRNYELKKNTKRRPYIIFIVVYTIIIFAIEPIYRDPLYRYSINLSIQLNKSVNFNEYKALIESFSGILGNYRSYLLIMIVIYNSANIFKASVFIMTYTISVGISAILKQIYQIPLMYYDEIGNEEDVVPLLCYAGWGNPSTFSIAATAVFLTLWKIIYENHRLRYKTNAKYITLFVIVLFILIINICKFLSGLHSLNDILFGDQIGFAIFFSLFYVIQIDLNNGRNLVKLINIRFHYYILINMAIVGFYLIFYFFCNIKEEKTLEYIQNINNSKCKNIPDSLRLSHESLVIFTQFLCNLGIIGGMKCEYHILFKGNEQCWRHYNFAKEEHEDDSLLSRISLARETQWNHTNFFISFIRMFVIAIICSIIVVPQAFFLRFEDNIYIVVFVKIFLIWNLVTFLLFFVNKIILDKLALSNHTIFALGYDTL